MEFDPEGNVVQAWGPLHEADGKFIQGEKWQGEWLASEHGIAFDEQNKAVWVSSYYPPSVVLKFTSDGKKQLLKIGKMQPAPAPGGAPMIHLI